ncbi:uncharacterized protein LOC126898826 [Daktulosphaira vitifoliae]|uniref:uncharacterized protein LOC126898826 n=1 Tax=Daktulosphaira vitifoliae TaxID=58002 RepID=UPI0021AA25C8|nr:uncharacterized protein LOC126898826 [Daktulosphaira vitifoliae]
MCKSILKKSSPFVVEKKNKKMQIITVICTVSIFLTTLAFAMINEESTSNHSLTRRFSKIQDFFNKIADKKHEIKASELIDYVLYDLRIPLDEIGLAKVIQQCRETNVLTFKIFYDIMDSIVPNARKNDKDTEQDFMLQMNNFESKGYEFIYKLTLDKMLKDIFQISVNNEVLDEILIESGANNSEVLDFKNLKNVLTFKNFFKIINTKVDREYMKIMYKLDSKGTGFISRSTIRRILENAYECQIHDDKLDRMLKKSGANINGISDFQSFQTFLNINFENYL